VIGFVSSGLILVMLLYEIIMIYRLMGIQSRRREREARLMTGGAVAATIAHEIKQPLSGMIVSADAGTNFLARPVPDFEEAKEAFKQIVADGHRAGAIIATIQAAFKKEVRNRDLVNVNRLIEETLLIMREELRMHQITVEACLGEQLPQIMGDRIQLQQVLVNLIANAVESMATMQRVRIRPPT